MSDEKEVEEKQIPANQHPAYIRFVAELQAKGMTVENDTPQDWNIIEVTQLKGEFIHPNDEKWQADPDYFKETVDVADPAHRCCVMTKWSRLNERRLVIAFMEWKPKDPE
jgi:hypothetical protein